MSEGNWFEDAFKILMSDPNKITALAQQWDQLGSSVPQVKPDAIDKALTKAASEWTTGGPGLTAYGQEVGDKLNVMGSTANQVASTLRDFASQLAKARSDLWQLIWTITLAAASSIAVLYGPFALAATGLLDTSTFLPATFSEISAMTPQWTNFVRPAGATTSILSLISAVRSYQSYAHSVAGTLTSLSRNLGTVDRVGAIGSPPPQPPATAN